MYTCIWFIVKNPQCWDEITVIVLKILLLSQSWFQYPQSVQKLCALYKKFYLHSARTCNIVISSKHLQQHFKKTSLGFFYEYHIWVFLQLSKLLTKNVFVYVRKSNTLRTLKYCISTDSTPQNLIDYVYITNITNNIHKA